MYTHEVLHIIHTAHKNLTKKQQQDNTMHNRRNVKIEGSNNLRKDKPGAIFTNIPNLSPILIIKFMTFVLVKIGPNLVFTKHVLARTIFIILF